MSDVTGGPGWWQASDGKWYPPQQAPPPPPGLMPPGTPPIDSKDAKAAAKAAKAHAKALRPWYKKKRYVGLCVLALIIVIAIAASAGSKNNGSNGPTSGTIANQATSSSTGCARTHPAYPDQQPKDCVALSDGSVAIANTTVTARWAGQSADLGNIICATVRVVNHNSDTISYNELYWKLQTPSGSVVDTNFQGSLGSGDIVAGGTASGTACFDDPGQTGTYVGIYKPDPFQSDRGIWLFSAS